MENIQREIAQNYSEYLKVDIQEEISTLEETIEDMLTRLEEFESLMEGVHTGGTSNLVQILPEIENSCGALEVLFNRVDLIEALVARVRRDVTAMEARMDAAEAETGPSTSSDLSLRNFLKPLFSKKSETTPVPNIKSPTYEPPDIFSTAEFFPPTSTHDS